MWTYTCTMCIILSVWMLPVNNNVVNSKRILAVIYGPWYSHQQIHRLFYVALNKRGHELVVATTNPMKDPVLRNYTEINMSSALCHVAQFEHISQTLRPPLIELSKNVWELVNNMSITVFNEPEFKKIYKHDSNEKFDAVIVEAVAGAAMFALAHRFKAPLIGLTSVSIHNFHRYVFANPILSSHPSNWELNTQLFGENLSFWQRLWNFIETWYYIHHWLNYLAKEQESVRKYLGNDMPDLIDIMRNMSVLLVNDNPIFMYARPEPTNAIFFNGIHIKKIPPSLPQDLRQFLDNATEGFIYVSLGSITNWHILPKEMLENFVEVFSKLPYKIVWKCEFNELSGKLDNAFISNWFPQQGVLAHPNIKLYIYQGGLQSTEEAVYYGVPILGISIMFDQSHRIQRLASLGAAIHFNFDELTKEHLDAAIRQIIGNKSYKEKMMYLSSLTKDQPYEHTLEHAIWWIEYVMRRKGKINFRFSEVDKPWYQQYEMDVIAFLATILFVIICVNLLLIFHILHFAFKRYIVLRIRS